MLNSSVRGPPLSINFDQRDNETVRYYYALLGWQLILAVFLSDPTR